MQDAVDELSTVTVYLEALWRDLLQQGPLDPGDNFFSLGGDSMLAIQMLVAVSSKYQKELAYGRFFMSPTIATLQELIETA